MKKIQGTINRTVHQTVTLIIEVEDDASVDDIRDDLREAAWCSDAWRKTDTQSMEVEEYEAINE